MSTTPGYTYPAGMLRVLMTNPPDSFTYAISRSALPGVVAANVFLSFMNPTGSGKTVIGDLANVFNSSTGNTTVTTPMTLNRITSHSGGTDVSSAIVANDPTGPASIAEVRVGNPTTTGAGPEIFAVGPPIQQGTEANSTFFQFPAPPGRFVIPPGTGLHFRTAAGNVNQLWNIGAFWTEL